jgi:hypothetical protein
VLPVSYYWALATKGADRPCVDGTTATVVQLGSCMRRFSSRLCLPARGFDFWGGKIIRMEEE